MSDLNTYHSKYFSIEKIDNQELFLIKPDKKADFFQDKLCLFWFEQKFNSKLWNLVLNKCQLTLINDNLIFGYTDHLGRTMPYFLFKTNKDVYRVHLERFSCQKCKSNILFGNPFVIDNYLGVEKEWRLKRQKAALALAVKNCPNCNRQLAKEGFIIASTQYS